jgi:carboxylate-amine ligase
MSLVFRASPTLTLGVEIELQLLDAQTRDLTPAAARVFDRVAGVPAIKPEIFQSMVEIATGVCSSVAQIRAELDTALEALRGACREIGVLVAGGGAHPFAHYRDRIPFPAERFEGVLEREQWLARRLAIYGLHIHLGMRDGDHAIAMMNEMLRYAPHLLALSAASPYWEGSDTGLADARVTVFESLPTAGVPPTFERWAGFADTYDALVRTRSIRSIKDLWWDLRPQPDLGTLELRICDTPHTVTEIVGLVALAQCLAAWLDERRRSGDLPARPPVLWLRENKRRVARHGLDAEVVVDDGRSVAPLRSEIEKLLVALEPTARRLGASEALAEIEQVLVLGAGYARQRAAWRRRRSLRDVADLLVNELEHDLPRAAGSSRDALPA